MQGDKPTDTWYEARDAITGELWCETRDPDDPYLLPSNPEQVLNYRKITVTYEPKRKVTAFEPSPDLQAKGHPSTWEDDDDVIGMASPEGYEALRGWM